MTDKIVTEAMERWKGEVYLDLCEQRNPGADEFAKGFNGGLNEARALIYEKLPALLTAMSTAQEPALDDDARLAQWFAGQLGDQAHQCRKVKWTAQADLYGRASDFLERIANRLQAKAPETAND